MTTSEMFNIAAIIFAGFAIIFALRTRRLIDKTLAELRKAKKDSGEVLAEVHNDILTSMGITTELLEAVLHDLWALHGPVCKEPGGCPTCQATIPALAEAVKRSASFQLVEMRIEDKRNDHD